MKKLSIEEKAKAYDNVREKIAVRFGSNVAKEIFSEYEELEDERIRKELIEQVVYIVPNDDETDNEGNVLPIYQQRIDKYIAWLEKQGEQKPAWSEEDEKMLQNIISDFEHAVTDEKEIKEELNNRVKFLKSLRPQSQWKPSEEQMEALEHFIVYHNGSTNYAKDLEELRLQLKKLNGE